MDKEVIIPLFGLANTSKSVAVSAQRRVNFYAEFPSEEDKSKVVYYGTPGLSLFTNLGAGQIRAILSVAALGILYVVHGNTLKSVTATGSVTNLGTLLTSTGRVGMDYNPSQIIIVDGFAGYVYNYQTNSFIQITDTVFPNGANTVTFLDSYFIVENKGTGQFYLSQPNDGTVWTPVQFSTADQNPDPLVRVWADSGILILLGQLTTEFWANNFTGAFTYSRIGASTVEYGCAAPWSVAKFSQGIIFLAQNSRLGGIQVITIVGGQVTPVSNSDLENAIASYPSPTSASGFSYILDKHSFYELTFPSAGKTWLFDGSTNSWSELTSNYGRHLADCSAQFTQKLCVSDYSNGNLYFLDPANYTDNGTAIIRKLISRHTFSNLNRLSCRKLHVEFEPGTGLITGQGSNPQAMLKVSRDGGHTYGNEHWTSIGKTGNYLTRAVYRNLGRSRDFVFDLTISDPVKTVIANASGVFA